MSPRRWRLLAAIAVIAAVLAYVAVPYLRAASLYLDYLQGWKDAGGQLFVHFTDVSRYDKWGDWGALELDPFRRFAR